MMQVAPRRVVRQPLGVVVFVVGVASLGAEIAAARLLAPYFGASTLIWANTIGIVLLALSIGYWLGGRIADRRPEPRRLSALVMAAAVAVAGIPFVAHPFLASGLSALNATSAGAFVGSLLAVLLLVAGPVILLGAVTPFAIRLAMPDVGHAGSTAGRLYALSTAGSLVGTFLASLALVPLIGTQRTFVLFAVLLAAVAAVGMRGRWVLAPLALVAVAFIPPGQTKPAPDGTFMIWEGETPYQYVRVTEDLDDGDRRLQLNEGQAVHSLYRPGSYLTGDVWDGYLVAPFAALAQPPRRIAILGNAAGTTARAYGHYFPATEVDGVEIDGKLTEVGRRWFDMRNPRLRTFEADARPFLLDTERRYDVIMVDAYRQPYIPFYLTTREFFRLVRSRLEPGGVVIVNAGHPEGDTRLERALAATMHTEFRTVLRDPLEPVNTFLIGSDAPMSGDALEERAERLHDDLRPLAEAAARRLEPAPRGGTVLTDDRAPVEWLIDRAIIEYAAEGGS